MTKRLTLNNTLWKFACCICLVLFSACGGKKKIGSADGEGFGGTEEVQSLIRLAQTTAQDAITSLQKSQDLLALCNPSRCLEASGLCSRVSALNRRNNELRGNILGALTSQLNLIKFQDFFANAKFSIEEDLEVNGKKVDAKVAIGSSAPFVEFNFNRIQGRTLEEVIMIWIHEAGHTIAFTGFSDFLDDTTEIMDNVLGYEYLDALGSCVAAYSTRPESSQVIIPVQPSCRLSLSRTEIMRGDSLVATMELDGTVIAANLAGKYVDNFAGGNIEISPRESGSVEGFVVAADGNVIPCESPNSFVVTTPTCSGSVTVHPSSVLGCRKGRNPFLMPGITFTPEILEDGQSSSYLVTATVSVRKEADCDIVSAPFTITCNGTQFVAKDPSLTLIRGNSSSEVFQPLGNFGGISDYGYNWEDYEYAHWRRVNVRR